MKRSWVGHLGCAWLFSIGVACAQAPAVPAGDIAERAAALPAANFYKPPLIQDAKLSPSGRWLGMTFARGGRRIGLAVFDLDEWKLLPPAASFRDADVGEFHWVNDDRLVYDILDTQRGGGDQVWWPGVFSVRRDGSEQRSLVEFAGPVYEGSVGRERLPYNHRLLHVPAGAGNEVIVGEWKFQGGELDSVQAKRLDVVTNRVRNLSLGVPPHVFSWLFDQAGEPRVVVTEHLGRVGYHWRAPGTAEWRPIGDFPANEAPWAPRFVDPEGRLYVVAHEDGRTSTLRRFDFAKGQPETEPLVRTPGFDFDGEVVSETPGSRSLGVRVLTDAQTTVWFDKRLAALQAEADRRLPGRINLLTCRRCDEPDMTVLVYSYSDRDAGQYWLYRAAGAQWRKIGDHREGLPVELMGRTDFARIKARDGLELPVWVTLPPGPAQASRPAVVLVHGGPWVRGRSWEWQADAQFLASRGYVVIEPEFRGSTGYGQALHAAGRRQWGRAMQDDVADALAWAIGKGWVDKDRVCIAGASYGGYATLMGLIRHPDLYRCGVAWVALTDPRLWYQWRADSDSTREVREYSLPELIGDPVKDADMIASVTPVLHADRIRAPLMLAFGGRDKRVPLVHGTRMRDALVAAGKPPAVWVVYGDEGHGWLKTETQLDFAARLEAFLARHLAPAAAK